MTESTDNEKTEITFTEAYDELKQITDKLNSEEIDADELVGLLKRGKGLEAALRTHLTDIEQEVTAIEKGEGIDAFRIVASKRAADAEAKEVAETSDFDSPEAPAAVGSSDDDIPF